MQLVTDETMRLTMSIGSKLLAFSISSSIVVFLALVFSIRFGVNRSMAEEEETEGACLIIDNNFIKLQSW